MKDYLNPNATMSTADEVLLQQINLASLEGEETSSKQKTLAIKRVQSKEASAKEDPTNDLASVIKPLMEGMSLLQQQVKDIQEKNQVRKGYQRERIVYQCKKCKEINNPLRCNHCFKCYSEKHIAKDCSENKPRL